MIRHIRSLVAAALALGLGTATQAQDQAAFLAAFSGQWFVFDSQSGSDGLTCTVALEQTPSAGGNGFVARARDCTQPLAGAVGWKIQQNQLALFDAGGSLIATLGGSQQRVTGEIALSERGLILERAEGDDSARQIAAAIERHRCIYLGMSQKCADAADLRKPAMTEEGGTYGSVGVVVKLNVRDQPRSNAAVVGALPVGTCLKVNFCTTASDGIWCRARFGDRNGWIRKTALRQGEWPVLTFVNSCAEQN